MSSWQTHPWRAFLEEIDASGNDPESPPQVSEADWDFGWRIAKASSLGEVWEIQREWRELYQRDAAELQAEIVEWREYSGKKPRREGQQLNLFDDIDDTLPKQKFNYLDPDGEDW